MSCWLKPGTKLEAGSGTALSVAPGVDEGPGVSDEEYDDEVDLVDLSVLSPLAFSRSLSNDLSRSASRLDSFLELVILDDTVSFWTDIGSEFGPNRLEYSKAFGI